MNHIGTSGDPFEMGASRPWISAHWGAHKLEQMTNFELRHGEAVAIGIALDVSYSAIIGWLSQDEANSIRRCLVSLNLPLYHEAMRDTATLLQGLEEFREHLGGRLHDHAALRRSVRDAKRMRSIDPKCNAPSSSLPRRPFRHALCLHEASEVLWF
jgi:3-dehydroquinate synthetase